MKRWILILSILGPALVILTNILYIIVAIIASPNLHDVNQVFGVSYSIILVVSAVAVGVAYLLGLVDAARHRHWGWFALVLLVPVLGSLIYGAAAPKE